MNSVSYSLYPTVISLVLVLSAAAGAAIFLRRWKGSIGRHEGPMQLRHVLALGPRERLALVKVGAKYLVVGVTTAGISAVAEFSDSTLEEGEHAHTAGNLAPARVET